MLEDELEDNECFNALCGYDEVHFHGYACTTECPVCGDDE